MDWGHIFLVLILDLILTVFGYLLVPIIYCLRSKLLTAKQIKKIIIINAICVWLVFQIIRSAAGESGVSGAVFLWSWVGYIIMKKKLLIPKEKAQTEKIDLPVDIPVVRFVKTETPTISSKTLFCRKCGERLEINVNFCRKCGAQVWKEDNKNDL